MEEAFAVSIIIILIVMDRLRAVASHVVWVEPTAASASQPPLTAVTPKVAGHQGLDSLASRYVDVGGLTWVGSKAAGGIESKTLLFDPRTGLSTALARMAPDAWVQSVQGATDHEHVQMEQTFVLEGSLEDEEGACTAGTFVWRPPGSRHSAHAGSKGCLSIGTLTKPNRFFGKDGSVTDMMGREHTGVAAKLQENFAGEDGLRAKLQTTAFTPNAPPGSVAKLGPTASRYVNPNDLPWEQTRFPGVEFKTLLLDPANGMSTSLVRFAPGASLPDHEHVHVEQTYVLEGSLEDDEGACTAGNFVWRPPGSRHAAHAGPQGCLALGIFIKPNRFFEADGSGEKDMLGRDYDATWSSKD